MNAQLLICRIPGERTTYTSEDLEILEIDLGADFNGPENAHELGVHSVEWMSHTRGLAARLAPDSCVRAEIDRVVFEIAKPYGVAVPEGVISDRSASGQRPAALAIRDPDHPTSVCAEVPTDVYEIDTGSHFDGSENMVGELGQEGARQWLDEHAQRFVALPADHRVRLVALAELEAIAEIAEIEWQLPVELR